MDDASPLAAFGFDAQLAARDLSLFRVKSQTKPDDKASLLALHELVRNARPAYRYLEVGSHLGGTLTPHLMDPRCTAAVSIDARPAWQPDVRGRDFDYPDNSSARMIAMIGEHAPEADVGKLRTFDMDASEVPDLAEKFDLLFIDGEHTNPAVFRDFLSTFRFAAPSAVIAFHDSNLIFDGLANIEALLRHQAVAFESVFLPLNVFAIATGDLIGPARAQLVPSAYDRTAFIEGSRLALWDEIAASRRAPG